MYRLHRKPRKRAALLIGATCIALLIGLTLILPPTRLAVFLFFVLVFGASFYLASYVLNSPRRGLFIGGGFTLYLVLRSLGLREWWYLLLIILLAVSIELYWSKK